MKRLRSLVIAAVAIAAAVVLFIVLRPNDDVEPTPSVGAGTTTTPPTTAATTTTPKPRAPTLTRVTIHIRHGRVLGGIRRVSVPRRMLVELFVTADVADHVHLHGYDRMRDVRPGVPARLRFRATTAGRFEVELEERELQIAEITVQP